MNIDTLATEEDEEQVARLAAAIEKMGAAAGVAQEDMAEFARTLEKMAAREYDSPVRYTNRAARRARARAEKRNA